MDSIDIILNLIEIIVLIGGGLILKSYLPSYFKEKGKNLATKEDIGVITHEIEEVKSQYSKDIEILRADLAKQSHVHQVRFEHEFKILADIWDSLIHLRKMTGQLRPILDTYNPEESEEQRKSRRLGEFISAYNGLADKIEKNRPFYPTTVYDGLIELIRIVDKEAIEYQSRSPNPMTEGFDPKYWEKAHQNSDRIIASIDNLCEIIRNRITT